MVPSARMPPAPKVGSSAPDTRQADRRDQQ
jgi:hypothetical protein